MDNRIIIILMLLLVAGSSGEVMAQQKKKSVSKASKQYVKYVKEKAQGKEKKAQKNSSDPATVTRELGDTLITGEPQDSMRAAHESFKQQATTDYENYRDKVNQDYAEFVKNTWQEFKAMPAIPRPVEKEKPPVVIKDEELKQPIEDNPLPIEEEIVTLPSPKPQPVPVAPIREQPLEQEYLVTFSLYGTSMLIRFSNDERFTLKDCSENSISDAWKKLSGKNYNNTIRDCLELRITKNLSDWAYLQMIDRFAKACLGEGNAATFLTAYIYCQSGYRMRLGTTQGKLFMLYATEQVVFNHCYFTIGNERYYVFNGDEMSMKICDIAFPQEQSMSLNISQNQ